MERCTYTIVLRRDHESVPWGFRLQGGANFATPLAVQSVQPNSVSAMAGLVAGDGVLKINGKNADLMQHEEAKEEILKSGNEVTFYVQRAATITWSPRVPAGPDQSATGTTGSDAAVGISRISLAASRPAGAAQNVGSTFNRVPKPFGAATPAAVSPPVDQPRSPLPLTASNSAAPHFSANNNRPPHAQPAVVTGVAPTKTGSIAGPMAPNNIVVDSFDDDSLPPPPPPLNGALSATSVGAPSGGSGADAAPLRVVVSAAAAAAAADRAARLANDRSASPSVSLAPVALGAGAASGRTSPRSLSPSYHSKVSHIRSRSAELLQQYVDAAENESPGGDQQLQQQKSAVLLALEQEEEFKRRGTAADAGRRASADAVEEEPQLYKGAAVKSRAFRLLEQEIERGVEVKSSLSQPAPSSSVASTATPSGFRSVAPPQAKPDNRTKDVVDNGSAASSDSGPLRCYSCGGLISGVFAKIRGRPIHSECIRCSRCRISLKTAGYFFVNDNMYCEQHAKEATRPADSGFVAYVVDAPGSSDY